MDSVMELSKMVFEETKQHKDYLHNNPELSFCEENTARYICAKLDEMSIGYEIINKTSIIGIIEHNDPNHLNTIALRADIDALPIIEDIGNDNHSTNCAMHACGHDIHTATLLSVAKILTREIKHYSATILLIFQQAEEVLPGGASVIMESKILDKFAPKLVIGQHVESSLNVGEFGICEGQYMASGDEIHIDICGEGGHAANASIICSPIIAASKLVLEFKEIEKNAPKDIPTIISIGKFIAEGATNVVPDVAKIEGTFRTMNEQWRELAKQKMADVAKDIEKRYGVEVKLNIIKGYSMLYNDVEISKRTKEILGEIGKVHDLGTRMTTEDFGAYSEKFKTIFYRCGIKNPNWIESFYPHTSSFKADDDSMLFSVAGMVKLVLKYIK